MASLKSVKRDIVYKLAVLTKDHTLGEAIPCVPSLKVWVGLWFAFLACHFWLLSVRVIALQL